MQKFHEPSSLYTLARRFQIQILVQLQYLYICHPHHLLQRPHRIYDRKSWWTRMDLKLDRYILLEVLEEITSTLRDHV